MLKELIRVSNTYEHHEISAAEVSRAAEILMRSFGSLHMIDEFLSRAAERFGVQVLYGGSAFERWYPSSGARHDGDAGGERIPRRIPLNDALAVIPLGPYEQALLKDGEDIMT